MATPRKKVKKAKPRGTQPGRREARIKSKATPARSSKGSWAGLGPGKQPQRTMRQAGGMRASLTRSQSRGGTGR